VPKEFAEDYNIEYDITRLDTYYVHIVDINDYQKKIDKVLEKLTGARCMKMLNKLLKVTKKNLINAIIIINIAF
jgi:hypothetical protein